MSLSKEKRKNCKYLAADMLQAIKEVKDEALSAWEASKKFKIPYLTLRDKIAGNHDGNVGAKSILSSADEEELAKWIAYRARMGFGVEKVELIDAAMKIAQRRNGKQFGLKGPSRHWFEGFMKRHPNLTLRSPELLKKASAQVTTQSINNFIENIIQELGEMGIMEWLKEHPQNFVNMDESGFELNSIPNKVLTCKQIPHTYHIESSKHNDRLTVTVAISASGKMLTPQIIFKESFSKLEDVAFAAGEEGMKCFFSRSVNGWQTSKTFFEYVQKIVEEMRLEGIEGPIVLIVDGFPGHLDINLQKFCNDNNVVYIILLPNATHLMQPLDVVVFKPVKTEYKKQSSIYKRSQEKTDINEADFMKILARTLKNSVTPELVKKSFEVTGLFPLTPNKVSENRIIATQPDEIQPQAIISTRPEVLVTQMESTQTERNIFDSIDQQIKILEQIRQAHINHVQNQPSSSESSSSSSQLIPTTSSNLSDILKIPQIPPQKRKRQFKVKTHGIVSSLGVINDVEKLKESKEHAIEEAQQKKRARLQKRDELLKIKKEKMEEKVRQKQLKEKEKENKKRMKAQKKQT